LKGESFEDPYAVLGLLTVVLIALLDAVIGLISFVFEVGWLVYLSCATINY